MKGHYMNDDNNNSSGGLVNNLKEDAERAGDTIKEEAHEAKDTLYEDVEKGSHGKVDPEHLENSEIIGDVKNAAHNTKEELEHKAHI